MGHSSLVGTDKAPLRPKGSDEAALGPSDNTDSGSDALGTDTLPAADPGEPVDVTLNRDQAVVPIEGTGEDSGETEASDIGVDRIINSPDGEARADDSRGAGTARAWTAGPRRVYLIGCSRNRRRHK